MLLLSSPSFLLLSLIFFIGCEVRHPPYAIKGDIDLGHWDFNQQDNISLDGQWEFYWQQLLDPVDFSSNPQPAPVQYINLPGFWNNQKIGDRKLPKYGFATYRLHLRLQKERSALALRVLDIHSAYKLWINGETIGKSTQSPPALKWWSAKTLPLDGKKPQHVNKKVFACEPARAQWR